jgi:hypothetical protein
MTDRAEIEGLIEKLSRQTRNLSSPIAMADTEAFKALLRIGEAAVPYILEALTRERSIGIAGLMLLDEITHEEPEVPPGNEGRIDVITEA